MFIAGREVSQRQKPFVIAEVAQTHDGSLGAAFAFIDVAKECGADAIKFQTHIASEESTPYEPWRVRFSRQDATRYEYWKRMEFSKDQWCELKAHADNRGIVFLSSPFSIRACEWLHEIGVPAWKIASGEVHNTQLLDWIVTTRKPIILSSGLSTIAETCALAESLASRGVQLAVLHCTTKYPTPAEDVGLNVFQSLLQSIPAPVGLSDHSGTIHPAIVATFLGASIIEVHLTMHRRMFGPDVSSSLTPEELSYLVKGVDFSWRMRESCVDKSQQLMALTNERSIFGRSIVASRDIARGALIGDSDLLYKKPGGGIRYEERHVLIGKRAAQDIQRDQILRIDDVK